MASPFALGALLVPLSGLGTMPPRPPSGGELARAIDRLGVVANVLYVAAHPDDENTRLLAWLVDDRGVRAAYLSMTRGDGGQNLVGPEQGAELGVIRTQELLAARRVDGAEQFFTRALDFGFSKRADETLAIWGKDEILSDVVRVVRRFKPDVMVTRFSTVGGDTHGHHTASAILAGDAFRLAADPLYRPDLGAPWQVRRLVFNKPTFNLRPGEDLSKYVKMDIGAWDPATGVSPGELAATSRSMHKSQGFGAAPQRGPLDEYFEVVAGEPIKASLLDGIDLSWRRVAGGAKLADMLDAVARGFDVRNPAASIPALLAARDQLVKLPDDPWKQPKLRDLDEALVACAGLWLDAAAESPTTVPGGKLAVVATAIDRAGAPVTLASVRIAGTTIAVGKPLGADLPLVTRTTVAVDKDLAPTQPYWLVHAPEKGRFVVDDPDLIGRPESPPPFSASFELVVDGHHVVVERPVVYRFTDPVHGERLRPIEILPPATVTPRAPVRMFPDGRPQELRFVVKASVGPCDGSFGIEAPAGWRVSPPLQKFSLAAAGDEAELRATVTPPEGKATDTATLHAFVDAGGGRITRGLERIDHAHIPIQTLLPVADVKLVRFDLRKERTRIAYLPGAGDQVAASLRQVGYDVTVLDPHTLRDEPLAQWQAIVVGVRAFNVDADLAHAVPRLLDYVAHGGTLVVQYNTNNRLSGAPPSLGPFPFTISQKRVTEENATVAWQDAPILDAPNKISDDDFVGWVQERGLYFADAWDPRYLAPLSMHDTGELPQRGALLVGHHGEGVFIYTGLSFFRQLPAGVPGAYRLLANLIDARP